MTNKLAETCSISYHVTPSRMCNSHLSNNSDPVQFNQNDVSTTCHTSGWEMAEGRRKVEANNKQSLRKSPDVTIMRSGGGSDGFLVKLKESDKPKYEGSIITHWHLVDPTLPAVVKEQSDLTQGDAHQAQDRCSLQTGEEHIMIQMSNLINLYFMMTPPTCRVYRMTGYPWQRRPCSSPSAEVQSPVRNLLAWCASIQCVFG